MNAQNVDIKKCLISQLLNNLTRIKIVEKDG